MGFDLVSSSFISEWNFSNQRLHWWNLII
jgi:hypothetical protein